MDTNRKYHITIRCNPAVKSGVLNWMINRRRRLIANIIPQKLHAVKQTSQFRLTVVVTAVILGMSSGCDVPRGFSHIGGGGTVESDGWWFSCGSVFLQPNEPGVLFGMKKTPDGNREFAYVVIFRHNVGNDGAHVSQTTNGGVEFDV